MQSQPRRLTAGLIAAVATLVQPATAASQPQPAGDADRNAALVYWRSMHMVDQPLRQALRSWSPDEPLPPELSAQLVAAQDAVEGLLRAAAMTRCDFEVDVDAPGAMEHLAELRQAARLLRADARRLLADGQPDAATERLAALPAIARHLRNDEWLLSSMTAMPIASLAAEEIQRLDPDVIGAGARARLIDSLTATLNDADPFGMQRALRRERDLAPGRARTQLVHDDGPGAGLVAALRAGAVGSMTESLRAALEQLADAWDQPDADRQIAELADQAEAGHFGPFARQVIPAIVRAREVERASLQRVAQALQHLQRAGAPVDNS